MSTAESDQRLRAAGPKGQRRQMMDPDSLTGRIAVVIGGGSGPGATSRSGERSARTMG
jgi:hypothetical protein